MKNLSCTLLIGTALLCVPVTHLRADCSWQTLAEFECALPATVDALGRDADGNLYAAVSTSDSQWRSHALIRRSPDRGATWQVVDELTSSPHGAVKLVSLTADPDGQVYAAGYITDERGQTRWLVRKGSAGGSSWTTVDDFALEGSQTTLAQGITVDAHGRLYVAGYGDDARAASAAPRRTHWLVRQSRDAGRTWSTIEDYDAGFSARATTILSTPNGLLVGGSAQSGIPESSERWLVRKGIEEGNAGFRWETVDTFQIEDLGQGYISRAHGLCTDIQGNLYAVGRSYAQANGARTAHWVVRRASSTGTDWTTVDTFQMQPGSFAAARAIVSSAQGVYVVGQAVGGDLNSHWVVRRSQTGANGTWSICDDFQKLLQADTDGAHRSPLQTPAGPYLVGLAIVCDADRVFAAGSDRTDTSRALVRKMELGRTTEVAAAPVR